tara:strand:+ start:647 stop:832 length:186 start_codon:yes stop_codon:yes gene_type:complete
MKKNFYNISGPFEQQVLKSQIQTLYRKLQYFESRGDAVSILSTEIDIEGKQKELEKIKNEH